MRRRRQTKYIVVHCSATPPASDIGADEIDDSHRAPPNNWSMIGYHCVIRRDGEVEFGRHFDEPGAHVIGKNYQSVGICMVGGIDSDGNAEDNFTDAQYESLVASIHFLKLAYPGSEVLGHRDLSPDLNGDGIVDRSEWLKECPCFDVRKWIRTETDL